MKGTRRFGSRDIVGVEALRCFGALITGLRCSDECNALMTASLQCSDDGDVKGTELTREGERLGPSASERWARSAVPCLPTGRHFTLRYGTVGGMLV